MRLQGKVGSCASERASLRTSHGNLGRGHSASPRTNPEVSSCFEHGLRNFCFSLREMKAEAAVKCGVRGLCDLGLNSVGSPIPGSLGRCGGYIKSISPSSCLLKSLDFTERTGSSEPREQGPVSSSLLGLKVKPV